MYSYPEERHPTLYGVHIGATLRILLNRPSAAAMRSYVKLLWPLVCTDMKRVCAFAVSYTVTHYYAGSRHWVAWSVGLSVILSVCHTSESWKKRLKRSNCHLRYGLGWAQRTTYCMTSTGRHGKGQFWVGNMQTIVEYGDTPQSSVQTRLNRSIWRFGCGLE